MTINYSPYKESNIVKTPELVSIDYTNQDFWSLKSRLIDFIHERFGPQGTELPNVFNDFVESSIAIMLMENWAFIGDTLSFKIDQMVNELFIDTVTETENAFRLAKLVGFNPQPPIGATSMWTASLNAVYANDVLLNTPVRLEVSSGGMSITIELFAANSNNEPIFDEPIVISAGARTNSSVIGVEGRTYNSSFTGTGEISQMYMLPESPVLMDSIRVEVNGNEWSRVESFTDSQPRMEYRIEYDSAWHAYLVFGNNRAGLIPPEGSLIGVRYRVGGGVVGNIVTGSVEIQKLGSSANVASGVPVVFRNYTRGKHGYEGDTISDVRAKLPLWVKTQDRIVSGSDFKAFVDQFATPYHGQIGKSVALLRNHGCSGNVIDLYILSRDNENLIKSSDQLKSSLREALEEKKMITDHVCIKDGTVIPTDIQIEVTFDKFYRKFELELRTKLQDKLFNFFRLNNWDFGKHLKETDIIKAITDMKEVNNVSANFKTAEQEGTIITCKANEIIRVGQINLSLMFE